jgi:signal transduction histidine kinase
VSVPGTAVQLPEAAVTELTALVAEALLNVSRHAGAGAHAWVLVEDLGNEVVVSVRDDRAGIPSRRLAEAESAGRMGVARSIRGRVTDLGGTITLDSAPGTGTEWEVRVPRAPGKGGRR